MKAETSRLVSEAFALFKAFTFFGLMQSYVRYDQVLMKSRQWNPDNPDLLTNKVKAILEQMDPTDLDPGDLDWYQEILWFWYHHATSCVAMRTRAQTYATQALELQSPGHPNRITRLLWFLTYDRVEDAKKWVNTDIALWDEVELQTARETISDYEGRKFWV